MIYAGTTLNNFRARMFTSYSLVFLIPSFLTDILLVPSSVLCQYNGIIFADRLRLCLPAFVVRVCPGVRRRLIFILLFLFLLPFHFSLLRDRNL